MSLAAFRKLVTGVPAIDRIQDAIGDSVRSIQACPLIDGVLIRDVNILAAAFKQVEHGLNREPHGYLVVSRNVNAVVWDDQSNNELSSRCLKLRASVDVTVSLWVF